MKSASALLALLLLVGCSNAVDEPDVDETSEELNAGVVRGYFEWDQASNTGRWLEAIAMHRDGTFEANVGNDVSNLSGHHYAAAGTYAVTSGANGAMVLTLSYDFFGAASDVYDVVVQGDALKMKRRGSDTADWFVIHKKKAVTLTFAADWSVSQDGPLVAGAPLVIRYAASRNPCITPTGFALSTQMHASVDGTHRWWVVQEFPGKPVKGVLGSIGHVPQGHHLALWFENGSTGPSGALTSCKSWDSKFGANYDFSIGQ